MGRAPSSDAAVRRLQDLIAERQLEPGDRLGTETELAEELAVSRPAVREAVRLLSRANLVRAARGRPGWIMQCAALSADPRYWLDGQLRAHVLTLDTELRLRAVDMGRS